MSVVIFRNNSVDPNYIHTPKTEENRKNLLNRMKTKIEVNSEVNKIEKSPANKYYYLLYCYDGA